MQDRVKGPAISLVILGAIGILMAILGLVMQGTLMEAYKSVLPPDQYAQFEQAMAANTIMKIAGTVFNLIGSGFILWGGLQMMKLQNRTIAFVASIIAMIPCFTGCCCIIGIPIGIWALIVLNKPDVKAAFTS